MARFKAKPFKKWLDALARFAVKTRDGFQCQKCKAYVIGYDCHWHHIKSRKSNYLRWDLINGLTLCSQCHSFWHDGPEGAVWLYQKHPARYHYITKRKPKVGSWKEQDFKRVEQYLIDKIKEFKDDPEIEFDLTKLTEVYRKRLERKLT